MAKPISFKDVVDPDSEQAFGRFCEEAETEATFMERMSEESASLPEDYLTQVAEVIKGRRFGHGSTAEGPDEVNL